MTRQHIFIGWLAATFMAFMFPPVGFLTGTNDSLVMVFVGQWAWIGNDIQRLDGYGRSCIHVQMLALELLVIAAAALAFRYLQNKQCESAERGFTGDV